MNNEPSIKIIDTRADKHMPRFFPSFSLMMVVLAGGLIYFHALPGLKQSDLLICMSLLIAFSIWADMQVYSKTMSVWQEINAPECDCEECDCHCDDRTNYSEEEEDDDETDSDTVEA